MSRPVRLWLPALVVTVFFLMGHSNGYASDANILRGWLSDAQCARGRAAGGTYTGTNPTCAKRCVSKGEKIVLVVPSAKQILAIADQAAVTSYVGDEVELSVQRDAAGNIAHIDKVTLLEKGREQCDNPRASGHSDH